jgi:YbgC/YbaW family acyl-CoA thioester hydrolase
MAERLSDIRYRRRVQFYETDLAGLVHFTWFFRYMEEAEHALFREAGLSIVQTGSDIGWPRIAAACDYHSPLHFEDEFEVWLRIAAITSRTLRYACVITRDTELIAKGTMASACVRKQPGGGMAPVDIPSAIRERFSVAVDAPAS